jgi:hypothetical protein
VTSAVFREAAANPTTASLPWSHLSVELGHLYLEDFVGGPEVLAGLMRQVAPWAQAAGATIIAAQPRLSTCFLVDDYFSTPIPPAEAIPMLLAAADSVGLTIDYLVRESACAVADGVPLAELVTGRLVPDPPPGWTGSRPTTQDSGWLCNGVRSPRPAEASQAMRVPRPWEPPSENGLKRHSVFVDVELWSDEADGRLYSCSFLAAIWQLLRLGLLRMRGEAVLVPRRWDGEWPDTWSALPPVIQLTEQARSFTAYRTFSVLPNSFLHIEHAVRTILSQVAVENVVLEQARERALAERIALPAAVVDRIGYVFTQASPDLD